MKSNLIHWFLSLSRLTKKSIMMSIDSLIIIIVVLSSFSLRLGDWFWPKEEMYLLIFFAPLVAIPLFIYYGL